MIVIVAARVLQLLRLAIGQHAQGAAGFEPFRLHRRDHLADTSDLTIAWRSPGGTHAETTGTGFFGGARGAADLVHAHQRFVGEAGLVKDALGAIGTILGTPASFDVQQGRGLDAVGVEILPMYAVGTIKQIVERQLKKIEGPGDRAFGYGVIHKLF